eukprot:6192953-Pleurochrysis_carterae.AAC.2
MSVICASRHSLEAATLLITCVTALPPCPTTPCIRTETSTATVQPCKSPLYRLAVVLPFSSGFHKSLTPIGKYSISK